MVRTDEKSYEDIENPLNSVHDYTFVLTVELYKVMDTNCCGTNCCGFRKNGSLSVVRNSFRSWMNWLFYFEITGYLSYPEEIKLKAITNKPNVFTPQYSWNTAKVGINKHQSINQSINQLQVIQGNDLYPSSR